MPIRLAIALVVFTAVLIACSGAGNNSGVSKDLKVEGAQLNAGAHGSRVIAGTVTNRGSKTYGYVQVQFNLYDSNGAQVGSTMTNVNNLEPGKTWTFEAIVTEDKATSFKVMDVSGF